MQFRFDANPPLSNLHSVMHFKDAITAPEPFCPGGGASSPVCGTTEQCMKTNCDIKIHLVGTNEATRCDIAKGDERTWRSATWCLVIQCEEPSQGMNPHALTASSKHLCNLPMPQALPTFAAQWVRLATLSAVWPPPPVRVPWLCSHCAMQASRHGNASA